MRLVSSAIALLLGCSLLAVDATDDAADKAAKCKPLANVENTFLTSVARLTGHSPKAFHKLGVDKALQPVDRTLPWLGKCLASIDVTKVAADVMKSPAVGECLQALEKEFSRDYGYTEEYFSGELCPALTDTAVPCLNEVVVPEVAKVLSRASPCCNELGAAVVSVVGPDIPGAVSTLSKLLVNTICSAKNVLSSTESGETTESCGFSLLANLISFDGSFYDALVAAVQIPEPDVCNAVAGRSFHTTTGNVARFSPWVGEPPLGICYTAIQNLVSYVKSFPIWARTSVRTADGKLQPLSDIFDWGTCVRADYLLKWVLGKDSAVVAIATVLDNLGSAFDRLEPAPQPPQQPQQPQQPQPPADLPAPVPAANVEEPPVQPVEQPAAQPVSETTTSTGETGTVEQPPAQPVSETTTTTEETGTGATTTDVGATTGTQPSTESETTTETQPTTESDAGAGATTVSETTTEAEPVTQSETEVAAATETGATDAQPAPVSEDVPVETVAEEPQTPTEDVNQLTEAAPEQGAEPEAAFETYPEPVVVETEGESQGQTVEAPQTGDTDAWTDESQNQNPTASVTEDETSVVADEESPANGPARRLGATEEFSALDSVRYVLEVYTEPLSQVCVHLPSIKTCNYAEIAFAFGDVGHVPQP